MGLEYRDRGVIGELYDDLIVQGARLPRFVPPLDGSHAGNVIQIEVDYVLLAQQVDSVEQQLAHALVEDHGLDVAHLEE